MINERLSRGWKIVVVVLSFVVLAPAAFGQADSLADDPIERYTAADQALASELAFLFSGFAGYENVSVEVHGRVARVSGSVSDARHKEQARELAAAVPGVLFVINDLETDVAVDVRVAPVVQRVRNYVTDAVAYLPIAIVALLVLGLFWFLGVFTGRLRTPFERMGMSPMVSSLMGRMIRSLTVVVGLILALDVLGITALVGAVLGTAGLVGIAIGFAFQDIIENYLAGLILSIRQPFSLGDHVQVGGDDGKVMRMTSRELLLMTLDGNHVSIPNGHVFKSTVYNYTRNPRRRFGFDTGIDVEEDLARVQVVGVAALRALPGVMSDPAPVMRVKQLGDSNVVVTWFGWVDQTNADFLKVRSEAIRLVKSSLDEAGVLMPEPIYNVRMQSVEALAPPSVLERKAKEVARTPVAEQIQLVDVGVEVAIEEQISEDLAKSDETNLLT